MARFTIAGIWYNYTQTLMNYIGLDAGSVAAKIVVLDKEGSIVFSAYQRHRGRPLQVSLELLQNTLALFPSSANPQSLSLTGSAGRLIGEIFGIAPVNEVVAHACATRKLYPQIRTIIELGGEDSKLIFVDGVSAAAKDFSMNSVCAAGTGSFLDQQAERLNLTMEEFSDLSCRSKKPPRIAGRCSVFAKSDMIHLQQIATPVEDIVAGLCFAVARNFKGSIAKGRCLQPPVSFQGGVAANKGMIRAFSEVFGVGELFIPEEFAFMGAIGAVWKDIDSGKCSPFSLEKLSQHIHSVRQNEKGLMPLFDAGSDFAERHLQISDASEGKLQKRSSQPVSALPQKVYLGIDVGSISTNLAVIDDDCSVLAKRYLMTAGRPIEAVKQGLAEIGAELGNTAEIAGVGTTGSGRYMIADYIGADIVKNEITAQATAAAFIDKDVDTIFEIGGQDSKFISLKNGVIVDFEMNKACAAGTGSFLEEQAEKLNIPVKKQFQEAAFVAKNPCRLGERCTVFMENSLMANLQRGISKEDLLSGLAYSIVQNYLNRVVCKRPLGNKIFFQGGVAFNKAVVAAFENYLGKKVIVPEHHDVTGAIGMALIAKNHMGSSPAKGNSLFKGFAISKRPYEVSSFACKGCSNICEINRVQVEGDKNFLFYGGRCDRYDVKKKQGGGNLTDLFTFRDEALWKSHLRYKESAARANGRKNRGNIGIPYIFYFHDFLPFWSTLLWELGFAVEVSPKTERGVVDIGNETILAETCFPVKAAHGHIAYLLKHGVDTIFVPSFVDLNNSGKSRECEFACPYTQTIPYMAKIALPSADFITPVVRLKLGKRNLKKEIRQSLKQYHVSGPELDRAIEAAEKAQDEFIFTIKDKGREVLSGLKSKAIVIVGRAYNSFDKGMNLDIPKKITGLGVQTIPMDFLPIEDIDIKKDWPNMYWRAGQRILGAARIIKSHPLLDAVYIGNFSCGPDSFIIKFFEDEMSGKSYLHLELDGHNADAGAITRCEAFLDSIRGRTNGKNPHAEPKRPLHTQLISGSSRRTIYIPPMADHAFAVAAALEYCGLNAAVLPESTQESVDIGKKFVSGKECYPCAVTTGDMAKKIMEPGFDPERSAFFMPSGSGPCRFGQYNIFHRMVIRDLGIDNVTVFSPNQNENIYKELSAAGDSFFMRAWEGVNAVGLLMKCLHQTRPYEKAKGASDNAYAFHLKNICDVTRDRNGNIWAAAENVRNDFRKIPVFQEKRPLIGIVGEIFVRLNRFSNENLVRKIEALGGEAYLTPFEEWINYINLRGARSALIKKDLSGMITALLKRFVQKRIEHRMERQFADFLRTLHEPDTRELLDNAAPYIHHSFEGEAILSIGKSIDLVRRGAAGIVNAMPFGCMPGTIVNALLRGVHTEYGIPVLGIPYDGTESLTTEIQLEAFIDQAKEYEKRR